ncbi:MAG: hypothetical protein ABL893_09360 [Hyphomicrobium sp.]
MVWASQIKKGDKIVVQEPDNSRWVAEITSTSQGALRGKRPEPGSKVQKIYAHQIIGREGGPIEKHAGNLTPGDVIYTPSHKSGLQYARVTKRDKWGNVQCVRWNEAANEWTKNSRPLYGDDELEWLGHETEPGVMERFRSRVQQDRAAWQASPGRTGMARIPDEENTYYTRFKERRWQGEGETPVRFSEPPAWEPDAQQQWDEPIKREGYLASLWRRLFR